ncbi:MAG: manganese catalase family protein [Firmicutes bacterium]|nr:manganese catalase family protein [Bacillota bacterium]MCL1953927.1 manganese catalase family protein [Bacillota bacterium]
MWIYQKKLQCPVNITKCDPTAARLIMTQYGGPDGEIGASLRYLSQRFGMVTPQAISLLSDIGTEELDHMEIVATMVHQLTRDCTKEDIKANNFDAGYIEHGFGIYPQSAAGDAANALSFQSKGDPISDLYENLAAEQKARVAYEYLINMIDDPNVIKPLQFLREREIVHFQRFGEALNFVKEHMDKRHMFYMNPQ